MGFCVSCEHGTALFILKQRGSMGSIWIAEVNIVKSTSIDTMRIAVFFLITIIYFSQIVICQEIEQRLHEEPISGDILIGTIRLNGRIRNTLETGVFRLGVGLDFRTLLPGVRIGLKYRNSTHDFKLTPQEKQAIEDKYSETDLYNTDNEISHNKVNVGISTYSVPYVRWYPRNYLWLSSEKGQVYLRPFVEMDYNFSSFFYSDYTTEGEQDKSYTSASWGQSLGVEIYGIVPSLQSRIKVVKLTFMIVRSNLTTHSLQILPELHPIKSGASYCFFFGLGMGFSLKK